MKKIIISLVSLILMLGMVGVVSAGYQMTITTNSTLTSDLICSDSGIRINADDVTLDCAGHKITGAGTGSGTGIYSTKDRGTIKNCVIQDFQYEIYINEGDDWTIEGNTIGTSSSGKYARFGMYLKSGSGHTITGNTIDLSDSSYASCRAIYLRYVSDSTVEYNDIEGSTYIGITIAKSSSTVNTVRFNNIKNCPQKTASDSGTDNTWDSNYYDDAIDWDCDGRAVHVIGNAADLNAYVVENGWDGLPTYVDNDGDGYGVNCQLGPDRNDHNRWVNDYKEKVFDNLQDDDLDWEYICRPWWDPWECDLVNVSIVPFWGPLASAQSMEVAIPVVDTTGFNWSQYIDIFYVDDEEEDGGEEGMNWSRYHTMTFWVYPMNDERQTTNLGVRIDNDPTCRDDLTYPTTLFADGCREFQQGFMLASNTWNKVVLDISQDIYAGGDYTPGDPRPTTLDNIKSVRFFVARDPKYWDDDQAVTFYIDDIRLLRDLK